MDIRIQHTKIIKKSNVPHFYQKMLLDFLGKAFFRKFYQFSIQFAVSSVQHTIHKKYQLVQVPNRIYVNFVYENKHTCRINDLWPNYCLLLTIWLHKVSSLHMQVHVQAQKSYTSMHMKEKNHDVSHKSWMSSQVTNSNIPVTLSEQGLRSTVTITVIQFW